jgi:Flp pilus assembly protein TadG
MMPKPSMNRRPGASARRAGPSEPCHAATLLTGDEGAVTMILAICGSLMIGTMCTALDTIHYETTQARMQMALDVATLSAGADLAHTDLSVAQWQKDARAYYNTNMPAGYMSLTMPDANFSATVTGTPATGQTIKLSASGSMPLLAPIFFGNNSGGSGGSGSGSGSNSPDVATVSASNTALRIPQSTLELALVLDNTGSMSDYASSDKTQGTKIQGLRTAAANLVSNIFSMTTNDSYIGLVPFTTMVNVGSALSPAGSWLTSSFSAYNAKNLSMTPNSKYSGSGWGGCAVEPRDAGGNMYPQAYAPKDVPGFRPFYYNVPPVTNTPNPGFKITSYNVTTNKGKTVCTVASTNTVTGVPLTYQTKGSVTYCGGGDSNAIYDSWGQPSTTNATTTIDQNGNTNGGSNGPCAIAPALFLTKSSSTLTTAINNMQANGSTLIPTGLLWGWRMLSSSWSNSLSNGNGWISTNSALPLPETTQNLQRVAIVLTDGENDPGSASGIMPPPSFNGLSGVGNSVLKAPTVYRPDGSQMTNGSMSSVDDINSFQLAVCTAMKNSGITIYAITFGTYGTDTASVAAQQTMQSCASPGNYYHAPTNQDLNTIFQQIAGNLGVLRLTQ